VSIATYSDLQTSVANWLHRSDLTALIPDFITIGETMLNGDLDSRSQEIRTNLTCDTATRLLTLPSDMVEMRRLSLLSADPIRVLEYKSPEQLYADNNYINSAQMPDSFTVIGGSIELNCLPDSTYTVELIYRQKLPALSNSNTTNWLLTGYPNAYLFASLLASAPYTQDDDRIATWQKAYSDAVDTVNSIDWYSGSGLRVRAR
jgi:hypothetical protein